MLRECLLFNTALRGLLPPQSLGVAMPITPTHTANGIVLHPQLACNITTITLLEHYTSSKLKSSAVTKDHHNNFVSFGISLGVTALYPNLISPIPDRQKKLRRKGHLPVQAGRGHAEPVPSGFVSRHT